jgi:membrane protein involved in colicin uptake
MVQRAERKTLPLNLEKLKGLREADRQKLRDLENERRKAKGEELLSEEEIQKMVAAEVEPPTAATDEEEDAEEPADFYLEEAARIMSDAFFKTKQQLARVSG